MSDDTWQPPSPTQKGPLYFPGQQSGVSPYVQPEPEQEQPQTGELQDAQVIDAYPLPRQQVISEERIRANREYARMMTHRERQQRQYEEYNPYRERV